MADPAVPDITPGDAHDEEDRPDPAEILALVNAASVGAWDFAWDPAGGSAISCSGVEVAWLAPDMEGHPKAKANGTMLAAAPELLRRCAQRIARLEELAGIVR
jgi:hypothetical protein